MSSGIDIRGLVATSINYEQLFNDCLHGGAVPAHVLPARGEP